MVRTHINSDEFANMVAAGWLVWHVNAFTGEALMMWTKGYLDWNKETRGRE